MIKCYRSILLEMNLALSFSFPGSAPAPFQVISGILSFILVTQDCLLLGKFIFET